MMKLMNVVVDVDCWWRSVPPPRKDPDLFNPPKSLSPDLKFGCLSVRKFYWASMDAWHEVRTQRHLLHLA